jgi:hypothetical protein
MAAPVHPYSDYGVALRTLKTARSWLSILLLLCVVTQFIGFALLYWTRQPYDAMEPLFTPASMPLTGADVLAGSAGIPPNEWFPRTPDGKTLNIRKQWDGAYLTLVPITQLLGLIAVCSMTLLVYITLQVTLIAQAPGVAHITRSLIWMVLLLFMVFPWQYFFAPEFPIPGVLYGYHELLRFIGPFVAKNGDKIYRYQSFLVIARFVFWPVIGMIVMIISAERFRAGIMLAIGHPLQSMMQPRPQPAGPKIAPAIAPRT